MISPNDRSLPPSTVAARLSVPALSAPPGSALPVRARHLTHSGEDAFRFGVDVSRHHHYEVSFQPGLIEHYGERLLSRFGRRAYFVLTDENVHALYAQALLDSLARVGIEAPVLVITPGETSKSLATFEQLLGELASKGFDRRGLLINFGGGVVCDLGGYVAASYMRGVDYANFSTSLIGQLDASVGGKVAVNTGAAKNLVGAFHHPRDVAGDPDLLASLEARDFKSGIAEAIKVAILFGGDLWDLLDRERASILGRCPYTLQRLIYLAAKLKMDLIAQDPYEDDLRRPLNLGHTLGHPIESEFAYRQIRHGEAVGIGIGVATVIARKRGLLSDTQADKIFELLETYDLLGFEEPIPSERVVERVRYVRLIRGQRLHFVLPRRIGDVVIVDDLSDRDLIDGFEAYNRAVEEAWA